MSRVKYEVWWPTSYGAMVHDCRHEYDRKWKAWVRAKWHDFSLPRDSKFRGAEVWTVEERHV